VSFVLSLFSRLGKFKRDRLLYRFITVRSDFARNVQVTRRQRVIVLPVARQKMVAVDRISVLPLHPNHAKYSMSALPPKADIGSAGRDVRFVPKADICTAAIYRQSRTNADGFLPRVRAGSRQQARQRRATMWPTRRCASSAIPMMRPDLRVEEKSTPAK
jgi:hypothetical protein